MAAHGCMFCSPAGAETGLYFLSWDMDGDAVCYALEVTTEDGEVLYADDSVWQNEVIFPADISSEAEEKIFWRVRPFDLYGGPLHGWTEKSLLMRPAVFWNGKRLFSVRMITRTGG